MPASPETPPEVAPAPVRDALSILTPPDRLSLDDFRTREPRLQQRPTLSGGFARQCARRHLTHATLAEFTAALDAFEHGAT